MYQTLNYARYAHSPSQLRERERENSYLFVYHTSSLTVPCMHWGTYEVLISSLYQKHWESLCFPLTDNSLYYNCVFDKILITVYHSIINHTSLSEFIIY